MQKKIVFVSLAQFTDDSRPYSGVYVKNLFNRLVQSGVDVALLFSSKNSFISRVFDVANKLARELISDDEIIIHVHSAFPMALIAAFYKAALFRRCKIVVTFHGSDLERDYSRKVFKRLLPIAVRRVDRILYVSEYLAEVGASMGLEHRKTEVLCAGVDTNVFECCTASSLETDILLVGNVSYCKGAGWLGDLLQARELTGMSFQWVGADVDNIGAPQRFPDSLQFLGPLPQHEVAKRMNSAGLLLHLPEREGFGLVVSEAAACGLPTLVSRIPALLEQQRKNKFGWVVDPAALSTRELASAIRERVVLSRAEHHKRRPSIADQYRLDYVAKRHINIYLELNR